MGVGLTLDRHPPCGQWLGIRPHQCPTLPNALECANGHLKATEWTASPTGQGHCRACDRDKAKVHYMGSHCVKGHLKTMSSWRWNGTAFYCVTCRVVREQRLAAERRRQRSRGWYDDGANVPISVAAKPAD